MQITALTDVYLEPFEEITDPAQLEIIKMGAATADAAETGSWQNAAENFLIAVDADGRPGFLLLACCEALPSAHVLMALQDELSKPPYRPGATMQVIADGEAHPLIQEGPAVLVFVPGVEAIDPGIEDLFDRLWSGDIPIG